MRLIIRRCIAVAIILFLVISSISILMGTNSIMQKIIYIVASVCIGIWVWDYFWRDPYK